MAEDASAIPRSESPSDLFPAVPLRLNREANLVARQTLACMEEIGKKLGIDKIDLKSELEIIPAFLNWAVNQPGESLGFPIETEDRIRQFTRQFHAFLLTQAEVIKDSQTTGETKRNIALSRSNQRLARVMTAVVLDPKDSPAATAGYLIEYAHQLQKAGLEFGKLALQRIDSARAQAAIIATLHQNGHFIVVPDHRDDEDLITWDLLGQTDFAAISRDGSYILYIDAKGNFKARKVTITEENYSPSTTIPTEPAMRKGIITALINDKNAETMSKVFRAPAARLDIVVPVGFDFANAVGQPSNNLQTEILRQIADVRVRLQR